eukprot:SAG31_NODE_273_length_18667_cov_3.603619_21_plen_82_part_00
MLELEVEQLRSATKEEASAEALAAAKEVHENTFAAARQAWQTVQIDQQAQIASLTHKLDTATKEITAERATRDAAELLAKQ